MLASFVKLFPFIWPFIKETLLGGRKHPLFTTRRKSKWVKIIISLLIVCVVSLVDAYLTISKENISLKKQLDVRATKTLEAGHIKLMFCENRLTDLKEKILDLQKAVDHGKVSCKAAKEELEKIKVAPPHSIPSDKGNDWRERLQKKLDEIED